MANADREERNRNFARNGDPWGVVVLVGRTRKCIIVAAALSLGGCQTVGPIAIDAGRDRYNNIIQSTSKQQAFENIIRVTYNEPTSFMDVTEVDATQTFTGTLGGTLTNIGARAGTSGGQVGSVAPGVSYSEAPLIRYVPLVGQGLVEQTVAPVNTDALAALYDSNWSVMPLLDLAAANLTLDRDEVGAALNLIAELDDGQRLQLISTKSEWTKQPNQSQGGSSGGTNTKQSNAKTPTASSTNDALVIYFLPSRHHYLSSREQRNYSALWNKLTQLYQGTQLPPCLSGQSAKNCMPAGSIELRTLPVAKFPNNFRYTAPTLRTLSGLGILKSATQPPYPKIAIVSPSDYVRIRQYWWNDPGRSRSAYSSLNVYTLNPLDQNDLPREQPPLFPPDAPNKIWKWMVEHANADRRLPYVYEEPGISLDEFVRVNDALWQLRRYMLIIRSDALPPPNAYVVHFDRGFWYIAGDDTISQQNFNLISLFLTVMAIPPTNPPLTTSITVGGS